MKGFTEQIAEMPVTEWRGARVRVSIDTPSAPNTLTSQMVIDDKDLDLLKNIEPPEHIDLLPENQAHMEMIIWQGKRDEAKKVIDILSMKISMKISMHLCRTISEEIKRRRQ